MRTIKKHLNNYLPALFIFSLLVLFPACNASKTTKGGAIGAGTGAVVGGVVGNQMGNTAAGAIIGAAVGGTAGALIGRHMDKQAEELREDLENAEVERIGEGIKITFDSGILFPVDSYTLNGKAKDNLEEMAQTLKKYDDTNILIEGHTDFTGPTEYNMDLSEDRAESVENYLNYLGVNDNRMIIEGYGESQPIATNETETGRQMNRRVEIAIFANEEMKRAAKRGNL